MGLADQQDGGLIRFEPIGPTALGWPWCGFILAGPGVRSFAGPDQEATGSQMDDAF